MVFAVKPLMTVQKNVQTRQHSNAVVKILNVTLVKVAVTQTKTVYRNAIQTNRKFAVQLNVQNQPLAMSCLKKWVVISLAEKSVVGVHAYSVTPVTCREIVQTGNIATLVAR
jgi:hypothetical protein